MNAVQENKLAMYRTTETFLIASTDVIRTLEPMPAKLAKLTQKRAEIEATAAIQAMPINGTVVDRQVAVDDAGHLGLVLAGKVLSFAVEKGRGELAAKVRLSPTDFQSGRNAARVQLAQSVHDAAQPLLDELAGYGVTAELLGELQEKVATAQVALSVPRSVMAARKAATERLKTLFAQADTLLQEEIDPLLVPLIKSNPQWHARYLAARIIIDRPGGHASPGASGNGGSAAITAAPATPSGNAKKG